MTTSATKLAKILASVEEKNKEFKKSTKPQQRVLVAQDVLAQIKAKRYLASPGTWTIPEYVIPDENLTEGDSVQKLFATQAIKTCNVCAIGGLFMSCTNLNNNTTVAELDEVCELGDALEYSDEKLSNGLNRIFTRKQLILIENYFENADGFYADAATDAMTNHIHLFNEKYPNPQARLKEIMNNIVENNGTFVPKKLKVAKGLSDFKLSGKEV